MPTNAQLTELSAEQREWTAADRDTFDKWVIGIIIFYGSLAFLAAAFVVAY